MSTLHSDYHSYWAAGPDSLPIRADLVRQGLKGVEFDAIAVRGVSGIVVGAVVAASMRKQLIVVRKPDVKSHSQTQVEGRPMERDFRYIFLDDFVASGDTRRAVRHAVESTAYTGEATYVGTLTYSWDVKFFEEKPVPA